MKIQKFLTALVAVAAIFVSCEKTPEGPKLPANVKTDLNFTLSITEVSYNSAQISVKHDGTTNDTWYGFITDQPENKIPALVAGKVAELTANGDIQGLESRTSKRVNLNDLEAATTYRYVVFAISPNGLLYGNMSSIEFTTSEGFLLNQSDDWTVKYESRNTTENKETYSIAFKNSKSPRCHVGFIPKWLVEAYENEEVIKQEIAEYGALRLQIGEQVFLFSVLDYLVFEEMMEFWEYYDSDESYFSQETFNENSTFELPRQASGKYYAVAIGFIDNKTPTFTYSASEVEIVKETASADYNNWLGSWTLKSANDITYTLTFEENDPNFSYYVYGWECGSSVHTDKCKDDCTAHMLYTDFSEFKLGIPFYYDATDCSMNIQSMLLGAEPSADGKYYINWGMFGYTEYQGQTTSILLEDEIIAKAAKPSDSKTTFVGLPSTTYNMDSAGNITEVNFTYTSLCYTMYDDKTYSAQPWNLPLELPASLEKTAAQPASSMANPARNSYRKESAIKSYHSIKNADYSKLVKADFLKK